MLLEWCRTYEDVFNFLPEARDMDRIPRPWIANVIHSIIGPPFKDFVSSRIEARNQQLIAKKDLAITVD